MPTNFVINFPGNRHSQADSETGEESTVFESASIKGEYNAEENAVYLQISTYAQSLGFMIDWTTYDTELTEDEPPRLKIYSSGSPK